MSALHHAGAVALALLTHACAGSSPSADAAGGGAGSAAAVRIWSIAVGVSRYQQADLSLEFAHQDAAAIDAFFASQAGGEVPSDRRVLLVDDNATRSATLTALNDFARRTAPEDMLVLFFAMHGFPDAGGDLYFLTYDTDPKQLIGTGLPQRDVEYVLRRAGARRIVLLADACHAGAAGLGAFKGTRGLELAETNRLVAALADSKPGTAVLMATSATEASLEGAHWGGGHGVFTHFLLAGLDGRADVDADRVVTVRELYDFVYRRVSDETRGAQHPELTGHFDNRMPLAWVGGAARPRPPRRAYPNEPQPPEASPKPAPYPSPTVAPQPQPTYVAPAPAPPRPTPPAPTPEELIAKERDRRWEWQRPEPREKVKKDLAYVTALLPKLPREKTCAGHPGCSYREPDRLIRISELASLHLQMTAHARRDAEDRGKSASARAAARKLEEQHRRKAIELALLYRVDARHAYGEAAPRESCSGGRWVSCDTDTAYYLGLEHERLGEIETARRWFEETLKARSHEYDFDDGPLRRLALFALAELLRREVKTYPTKLAEAEKAYLAVTSGDIIRKGHSYRMETASHYRVAKMYEERGDRILAKMHYQKFTPGTAFMAFIPEWAK